MIKWLDARLVTDWRKCRHWLSLQLTVLLMVAQFGYEYSDLIRGFIPDTWFHVFNVALLVTLFLGRVFKQKERE
jgi:hypothetical protein